MLRKIGILTCVFLLGTMCLCAQAQDDFVEDMGSDRSPDAPKISLDGEAEGQGSGTDYNVQDPNSDFYDDMGPQGGQAAPAPPPAPPEPKIRETDEFGEPVKRW